MTPKVSSIKDSSNAAESETKVDLRALKTAAAKSSSKNTNIQITSADQSADTTVFKTEKSNVIFEAQDGDGSEHGY